MPSRLTVTSAQSDIVDHSVREAFPDAPPETATELSPRECCASTLPAPAALVIAAGGALGDAAMGDGVLGAGVGAARDGNSAAALAAEEDCPEA